MDRLVGVVRSYDWGSCTKLAQLRGVEPSELPEAELWFGAHPAAPATFAADGRAVTEMELPVLAKFLAVARPLSLQVHPDDAAAVAGYRREEQCGLSAGDARRCFRDPVGKPEVVVAVDYFSSLCGLLPSSEALVVARALGMPDSIVGPLVDGDRRQAVAGALAVDGAQVLPGVLEAVRAVGSGLLPVPVVEALNRSSVEHPEDPALLLLPLMHHVVLEPGEALFVPPGMLHTHQSGMAIEVMANSDSVVRAGLTTKYVDADLFLDLIDTDAIPLVHRPEGSDYFYNLPTAAFSVRRLSQVASTTFDGERPTVVVCSDGSILATTTGSNRVELRIRAGEAAWLGPRDGPVELSVDGTAYLIFAGP
ncbi:MAG TPA: mannose-6-phosphate isomerase, class I [Acidimicrobiaceae bacterium]|nr:mannose-6-phosphate isomerase, class I [Acidimicrobiaceae bacterium]HCV34238.1 mannose-6-phosphate isomerase, class I [Acidimicrobiaceae bacterium]